METLIETVGNFPQAYFLEFSSKEEYLQKVQTWKDLYKALSQAIRRNKRIGKEVCRAQSLVRHRMDKAGRPWWVIDHYTEYDRRVKLALSNIDRSTLKEPYNATFLLKIRGEMKAKSARR